MKSLSVGLMGLLVVCSVSLGHCKTLDDYVKEAEAHQRAKELGEAIGTMEQAVKQYPDSSGAYTFLGILLGDRVQRMRDFSEMFVVIERVFEMWDKALELDPHNVTARFHRGAWAVNIPKFVGKLETGIKDMEMIAAALEQSSDMEARAQLTEAYQHLANGYQRRGEYEKAKETWNEIITIAPETELAETARRGIENITRVEKWLAERQGEEDDIPEIAEIEQKIEKDPNNVALLMALSKVQVDNDMHDQAYSTLKRVIALDQSNVDAYRMLAATLEHVAAEEYDPRISLDTDLRTDLAFEVMMVLDKIVALAPDDLEMRFARGVTAVEMPFFVGKLDQGIGDLKMIAESDAPDAQRAEAHYWLGVAYRKKAMTQWISVVSDYPNTEAAQSVFDDLNPGVRRLDISQYRHPIVVIDFILGFKDELAPQTAVWVEDKDGDFVKTIYVSGFSGHAKEKQINLPIWARSSKFADADAITGASIDLGHHVYVWDMKNVHGERVTQGDYVVKVEVMYWPSMQYQRVEAPVTIARKGGHTVVEEGNLIPYLEVKYVRR